MSVSRRVLTRHIASELHEGTKNRATIEALAAYIVSHRLQSQLDLIVADVAANLAALGHVEADVTTARPIEASLRQELIDYVRRIEGVKDVTLVEQVDPSILGGVIIETPRKRFDASVSTKLKRLKNA